MLLPIGDENPRERIPYVNYALLAANVAVFFLFCMPERAAETVFARYALKPSEPRLVTLLSSMFLHANLLHLAGNMLFLWIFGDNVEDRLGHAGYAAFYLASGLAAAFSHIATTGSPNVPLVGASGAVSGVVGAYAVFFPRHRVKMLLWFWFYFNVLYIPAFWWIGFWFLQQVLFAAFDVGPVAYAAHIGGFTAGAAVALLVRAARSAFDLAARRLPSEIREASGYRPSRRPFITIEDDEGIDFLDDPGDRYAVLRLADDLHHVSRIAATAAAVTSEDPRRVARRLEATRGLISKDVPRSAAERIQRELRRFGLPAAIIHMSAANRPPRPAPAAAMAWDDAFIRFTAAGEVMPVLWTAPFLYLGARVGRLEFIDVFVSRRAAFRVGGGIPMRRIDAFMRREFQAGIDDFADAVIRRRSGAAINEGVRILGNGGRWGWLNFGTQEDYEDYAYWIYNIILSGVDAHRI